MTAIQGDLLEYLANIDTPHQELSHEPGWVCPTCGSRFSGSEAEVSPHHDEPWPPSPAPGRCATQKIKLDMLLLRLSPAWKSVAWRKHEDVLAQILKAKQAGVDDALLGRVLADERLHNWALLSALFEGQSLGNDLREPEVRQAHIQEATAGTFTSLKFRVLPEGVEVTDRKQPARLIRWEDLPEPGGTK